MSGSAESTSPGADREHEVARPGERGDERRGVAKLRRPADAHARPSFGEPVDHELAGHSGNGLLARGIDLGDAGDVGARQRFGQLVGEVERARVEVRLEEREHAAAVHERPRRLEGRGDLRGMVAVVVVEPDAVHLRGEVEAAVRAGELGEHALRVGARHVHRLEGGERAGGVQAVVLARHGQLEVHGLEISTPDHGLDSARPRLEGLRELGVRAEGRVVVELDVRHDSDRRGKREDASVRLVSLDDEPAAPGPGVAAELRNLAADEERRVAAEPVEHEGDHRGGRRLAMCAGDDDGVREADELGEELGAGCSLDSPGEGGRDEGLRVGRRLGRAVRDLHRDSGGAHAFEVRGLAPVPARSRPHPTPWPGSRSRSSRRRRFPPARSSGR